MNRLAIVFVLLAMGLLIAPEGFAAEGRIPIAFPNTIISAPGHYVVTRNLHGGGQEDIVIEIDGVTLDLNGFTLAADPTADVISIQGNAGQSRGVTIRNGRIKDGFAGIYADATVTRKISLEGLAVAFSGENGVLIQSASRVVVRDCSIAATSQSGLVVFGSGAFTGWIVDNQISRPSDHGIYLYGLSAGVVENNRLVDTGFGGGAGIHGIWLDAGPSWNAGGNRVAGKLTSTSTSVPVIDVSYPGVNSTGVTIRNGTVSGGRDGVYASMDGHGPVRVENVTSEGAFDNGFLFAFLLHAEFVDCTVREAGLAGIWHYAPYDTIGSSRLERNVVQEVAGHGIIVQRTDGAIVADNVVQSCGEAGISVYSKGARVDRKTVHGAGSISPTVSLRVDGGALVRENVVTDGGGRGIRVSYVSGWSGTTLVQGNTVRGNTGDGIEVSGVAALVEDNQVWGNGGWGIRGIYSGNHIAYRRNMLRDNASGSVDPNPPSVVDDLGGNICDAGSCP